MQQLTAPPRDSLTADQVWSLLRDYPNPLYGRGLEILDSNLNVLADVSDYLQGGTVTHDFTAQNAPHRNCTLTCSTDLLTVAGFDRGRQLLRPYMTISDGMVSGRFDVGIFRAARPQVDWSTSPGTVTITGADLLSVLNRPIGRAYGIPSATTFYAAAVQMWADAGMSVPLLIDSTNATATLAAAQTWPVSQENTWLAAFNWIMAGMGYAPVYMDEAGNGRAQSYVAPTVRAVQATLDFDDLLTTIIAPDRQDTTDQGEQQPVNVWIFQQQNVDNPVENAGQYTVRNQSSGANSIDAQDGLEWATVISLDVPDQATLVASGNAQVDAALAAARKFTLHTRPFPIAGHGDVIAYSDLAVLGGRVTVQEQSWTLDLGNNTTAPADMEFTVGEVVGWSNSADAS